MACCVRGLIVDDHILKRVDRAFDASWLHGEVREVHYQRQGGPGSDPDGAGSTNGGGLVPRGR